MGAWLGANGEAVYGAVPSGFKVDDPDVYLTEKQEGDKRFLYVFIAEAKASVTIPSMLSKGVSSLETGQPLEVSTAGGQTVIILPDNLFKDKSIVVLKAEL